jgi:hypothetical protein
MLKLAAPVAFLHQAVACEQIAGGAGRGQVDVGMPRCQPIQQLARSPTRMGPARLADQLRHPVRHRVRTLVRSATLVTQGGAAAFVEAAEPLVSGLPTDRVARTQLRHRVESALVVSDESFSLLHGCRLLPGHRPTSCWSPSVAVLPMLPV